MVKLWELASSRHKDELAEFSIVDKIGSEPAVDFNMAQFFVLRTYKGKGIGRYVTQECFNKFRGVWETMIMPGNEGTYRFWKTVIVEYCDNHFTEYCRNVSNFSNELRGFFRFDNLLRNNL